MHKKTSPNPLGVDIHAGQWQGTESVSEGGSGHPIELIHSQECFNCDGGRKNPHWFLTSNDEYP